MHFEVFASILRDARNAAKETVEPNSFSNNAALDTVDYIQDRLETYFQNENPRFDKTRFRRAIDE